MSMKLEAVALVVLIGLGGCETSGTVNPVIDGKAIPASSGPSPTPYVAVTEYFPSLAAVRQEDMFRLADIVAVVRITGQTDKAIGPDYVWRESQVEIVKIYKGPPFAAIQQPGGAIPGRQDVFYGIRYLEVGAEYLVFLDISTIGGTPSIEFFADPEQLALVQDSNRYVSLDGRHKFTVLDLDTLSR